MGQVSVLKGPSHIPGIGRRKCRPFMYVCLPLHACAKRVVWWQAGSLSKGTLHTQRQLSSAVLRSLTRGDQLCDNADWFCN